jgi:hypothetical protein
MMDRYLHVETLILIPTLKIYLFHIPDKQMTDRDIIPGGLGNLISLSKLIFKLVHLTATLEHGA